MYVTLITIKKIYNIYHVPVLLWQETKSSSTSSVADPDAGSGMGKNQGPDPGSESGMNISAHISESLETIFLR
jgi:hypothetical protein